MEQPLVLVKLTESQAAKAKAVNGLRRKITHGLICGTYGQIFGTEKHCRKYFDAWSQLFGALFDAAIETDAMGIVDFTSTFDLVNVLLSANDQRPH